MTLGTLPANLPGTQSFFYMRIISFAHHKIYQDISPQIEQEFKMLEELSLITPEMLVCMIDSLISYLQMEDNLKLLDMYYQQDCKTSSQCIGHIAGQYQERILEHALLDISEEDYKGSKL